MSVLSCQRLNCPNIMCDNSLNGYYICGRCTGDYLEYKRQWLENIREMEVNVSADDINQMIEGFFLSDPNKIKKFDLDEVEEMLNSKERFGGNYG